MRSRLAVVLAFACCTTFLAPEVLGAARRKSQPEIQYPVARMVISGSDVWFEPVIPFGALDLSFAGPDGVVQQVVFLPGEIPYISLSPDMPDGIYKYELRVIPEGVLLKRTEEEAVEAEPSVLPLVQNGSFHVKEGQVLTNRTLDAESEALFTIVHSEDVVIKGSLGVGWNTVDGENFGYDTIRLKEDNLRIKFEDTSTAAGFPSNDWQLTANDSASGGMNYFAIDDVTAARTPFKVEAGAPTNSFHIGSTGRIGLRTATPVLDVHTKTSNTPGFRLEQDSSGGFTAQTWDIAGNEANFFVRDVTGGSRLPFRIRPGAPTSSIDIAASGNVGMGIAAPERLLHLRGANAVFRMDRPSDTVAFMLVRTDNASPPNILKTFMVGTNASGLNQGEFLIADFGNAVGGYSARRMTITNTGDVQFTGSVSSPLFVQSSSLAFKTNIRSLDQALDAVNRLRGVRFDWKQTGEPALGLIAEEVEQVIPEVVAHEGAEGKATGINYAGLVAVLVEAVKSQQQTIEGQREAIAKQQQELLSLKTDLEQLKNSLR
jgi:hypothetical protein